MNILTIHKDNWSKMNNQFMKGGFNWDNQGIPDWKRWYYTYYISEGEERSCRMAAKYGGKNMFQHGCGILKNLKKLKKNMSGKTLKEERGRERTA
jgi:hypothetical protein